MIFTVHAGKTAYTVTAVTMGLVIICKNVMCHMIMMMTKPAHYLMYSPGLRSKLLCMKSMPSWFSAMWVCRRTPSCWRASLAAAIIISWVTLNGEVGAKPILSIEYLSTYQYHLVYASVNISQDSADDFPLLLSLCSSHLV